MSLPTLATFYKNDTVVGAGFCNIGWFIRLELLKHCIIDCMDDAWERYRPEHIDTPEYLRRRLNNDQYFTNAHDLANFEYILIYDIKIPRNIAMSVYAKTISDEEWNSFCDSLKEL